MQASQAQFDRAFASFPKDQIWRLFIDWNRQEGGPDCFDVREPGYRAGMEGAFSHLRDSLGKRLDANEFCHVHDLCVDGVRNGKGELMKKGFSSHAEYQFENHRKAGPDAPPAEETASPEAIQEAFDKGLYSGYPDHMPDASKFLGHYDDHMMRSSSSRFVWKTKRRINGLIDTYYKRIASASTNKEKLAAIVDLCQALEVYHVYNDGNQRTIAFTLLPKLLIENGFTPAILERPYLFDGQFTTNEMVQQVEQGMKRFSRLGEYYRGEIRPPLSERLGEIDAGISFRRAPIVIQ